MKRVAALMVLFACVESSVRAAEPSGLPRSRPEAQGVSPARVLEFIEAADRTDDQLHSVVVVRHGKIVAEGWWTPYNPESRHELYSLSKSFTSTAVGMAVAEGKLSVDDEVLKFFPDDAPAEPTNNLKSMRVSDLLRMNTGHQVEPNVRKGDQPWTKTFLAQPVPFKPGTHFLYNTSATYMLSAIVQKVTGSTVLDYLTPRLFQPLGIENPTWGTSPQGVSLGGYGLSVRTEDIAKFGQLYLQKGTWEGKTLIPSRWVAAATARQTSNGSNPKSDWDQGYGYQFWRCRHGAYRGDGAFGQYCVVLPEQDAVVAITSGVKNMQAVLDLVWDKLLPAFSAGSVANDDAARDALQKKLASLSLRPIEGSGSSAAADKVAGKRFRFESNNQKIEAVSLEPGKADGEATLVVKSGGVEHRIPCARGAWRKGRAAFGGFDEQPVAATGAWTGDDVFTAKVCIVETPFVITTTLTFEGDQLRLDTESNVGFAATKAKLTGKAE